MGTSKPHRDSPLTGIREVALLVKQISQEGLAPGPLCLRDGVSDERLWIEDSYPQPAPQSGFDVEPGRHP